MVLGARRRSRAPAEPATLISLHRENRIPSKESRRPRKLETRTVASRQARRVAPLFPEARRTRRWYRGRAQGECLRREPARARAERCCVTQKAPAAATGAKAPARASNSKAKDALAGLDSDSSEDEDEIAAPPPKRAKGKAKPKETADSGEAAPKASARLPRTRRRTLTLSSCRGSALRARRPLTGKRWKPSRRRK